MFLTFPIMVIKVNTVEKVIEWRWERMLFVGLGSFSLSFVWRYLLRKKEAGRKTTAPTAAIRMPGIWRRLREPKFFLSSALPPPSSLLPSRLPSPFTRQTS